MNILQRSYLKLADHRNGKRVWLQGLRLEEAGYAIGSLYSLSYDDDQRKVTLSVSGSGTNKVCRKKVGDHYLPLIDIVNQRLADIFEDVDRVQVLVYEGRITIEYHQLDWKRFDREQRLAETLHDGKAISIASMAHGSGILDFYLHKGLEDAGLRSGLIWAIEPESVYLNTSWLNNPTWSYDSQVIEGRIEDIDAKDLKSPLILAAGLPCTGASLSGRSKGKLAFAEAHETSGTAFIGWLMAIKELSPAICILENVPQYASTVSMHLIRQTLKDWRYTVHEIIVDRELGAFEDRKRMCMVAVSEGIEFKFDLKPVREREQTLGEILDDVPLNADCWNAYDYLHIKEASDLESGKGFAMQLVDTESTKVGTIGRGYNRVRSTEPLVKHPTDNKLKRLLTVNELSKVKTIDIKLVAGMSRTRQVEMLGQSVLGVAFQAVGRNLGECLKQQFPLRVIDAA
ncbi:MAG: DNA cytosine methyltransferase [Gammaproteobacteria bacterium]|nr:DNA cytosine methyltransferase [Gammaproteobacteria bacterium]